MTEAQLPAKTMRMERRQLFVGKAVNLKIDETPASLKWFGIYSISLRSVALFLLPDSTSEG